MSSPTDRFIGCTESRGMDLYIIGFCLLLASQDHSKCLSMIHENGQQIDLLHSAWRILQSTWGDLRSKYANIEFRNNEEWNGWKS